MEYGLIGENVSHSYSKEIHERIAGCSYELVSVPREELEAFVTARRFKGINVTIPYKREVMKWCDEIDPEALEIGSVNTLVVRDGRLIGYNTDYFGFGMLSDYAGISFEDNKVLVLGSGGTSRTVSAVARDSGASSVVVISRSGDDNYDNVMKRHSDARVIVNTTPLGMSPAHEGEQPLSLEGFRLLEGVIDVIYRPLVTPLLAQARRIGVPNACGLLMLVAQAHRAEELFTGKDLPLELIDEIEKDLRKKIKRSS